MNRFTGSLMVVVFSFATAWPGPRNQFSVAIHTEPGCSGARDAAHSSAELQRIPFPAG